MHEASPIYFGFAAAAWNTYEDHAAWHFAWVSKLERKASSQGGTDWLLNCKRQRFNALLGAFERCWKHAVPSKQGAPSNNDMQQ